MTKTADSDILVHWLELNLSRRLVKKVYGVSLMPETYLEWKALAERLDAQQCRFDGIITQHLIKDQYPLPSPEDTMDVLKSATIFSKIDVKGGFPSMQIWAEHQDRCAFLTPHGLFEPAVMWPGLQNAPLTFQRFMNHVLQEEIAGGHVQVYVDDVIVFSEDLATNWYWMDQVFQKFRKYGLCLRLSKCEFEKSEVIFLGMKISHNHLEHDLAKGVAIRNWP